MSMTRDDVKAALREVTQISERVRQPIPKDARSRETGVQLGQKVGVSGTPTFFINGIRLGGFRPAAFDAVIAYELKKAGVTSRGMDRASIARYNTEEWTRSGPRG